MSHKEPKESIKTILRRYRIAIAAILLLSGVILFFLSKSYPGYVGEILADLGKFLASIVAISFIYEWLIKEEDRQVFLNDLSELLSNGFGTLGVRYYPNRRAIANFEERFSSATEEVCILQTNLTTILELIDCLKKAKLKIPDLRVRILTLDPESSFLDSRGHSLWSACDGGTFRDESRGSLKGFLQRAKQMNLDCEIRLYDELPAFVMFKIDSNVILAFVTACGLGRHHSHIEVSETLPGVSDTFVQHFNILWDRAKPLQELKAK